MAAQADWPGLGQGAAAAASSARAPSLGCAQLGISTPEQASKAGKQLLA